MEFNVLKTKKTFFYIRKLLSSLVQRRNTLKVDLNKFASQILLRKLEDRREGFLCRKGSNIRQYITGFLLWIVRFFFVSYAILLQIIICRGCEVKLKEM